jgi:hypothetical protein
MAGKIAELALKHNHSVLNLDQLQVSYVDLCHFEISVKVEKISIGKSDCFVVASI